MKKESLTRRNPGAKTNKKLPRALPLAALGPLQEAQAGVACIPRGWLRPGESPEKVYNRIQRDNRLQSKNIMV